MNIQEYNSLFNDKITSITSDNWKLIGVYIDETITLGALEYKELKIQPLDIYDTNKGTTFNSFIIPYSDSYTSTSTAVSKSVSNGNCSLTVKMYLNKMVISSVKKNDTDYIGYYKHDLNYAVYYR